MSTLRLASLSRRRTRGLKTSARRPPPVLWAAPTLCMPDHGKNLCDCIYRYQQKHNKGYCIEGSPMASKINISINKPPRSSSLQHNARMDRQDFLSKVASHTQRVANGTRNECCRCEHPIKKQLKKSLLFADWLFTTTTFVRCFICHSLVLL